MINFKATMGKANFYFVRHGESMGNQKNIIQGHKDYPLSSRGRAQAQKVAEWFKNKKVSLIVTSPLSRARETAEIIREKTGTENFIENDNLIELDTGIFSGESLDELPIKYPEVWKNFQQKSWEGVPGAEKTEEIYGRAEKHWKLLLSFLQSNEKAPERNINIVTVSHAGLIQWLIKASFGHRAWMPLFPMSNTGISLFALNNTDTNGIRTYLYRWEFINFQVYPDLNF